MGRTEIICREEAEVLTEIMDQTSAGQAPEAEGQIAVKEKKPRRTAAE